MAHYSRLFKIVIDVPPADHDRELAFWSAAAGQPLAQGTMYPRVPRCGAARPGIRAADPAARAWSGPGAPRHPYRRPGRRANQAGGPWRRASAAGALLVGTARSRRAAVLRSPRARRLAQ